MKKKLFVLFALIISLVAALGINTNTTLYAADAVSTSNTYGLDIKRHISKTQDAYLASKAIVDIGLDTPTDMVVDDNDVIIIANSKVKNIKFYDTKTGNVVYTLEHPEFKNPCGVYLLNNNLLYVADKNANQIFLFERNALNEFDYVKSFGKPNSMLYANNDFKPSRVAVDLAQNMYVVADGVTEGIIQLDKDGIFLGYFATNKVVKSLKEKMQELIYDDETLELLGSATPPIFTNVFTDRRGLVYSTTSYSAADEYEWVKKHNTSGANILGKVFSGNTPLDIYVGSNDVIYVADNNGYIYNYTGEGELLFVFGGSSPNDISGLFSTLSSLAVDSNNNIWCLDSKKSALHRFIPTDYTKLIYEALDLYTSRNYEKSIEKWQEVLKLNSMSAIAHNQIGLNYLYSQDYDMAMYHLKLASNRKDYSQAFWEVRNTFLQTYLGYIVIGLLVILALFFVLRKVKAKRGYLVSSDGVVSKFNNLKFVRDTKFNLTIIKNPYDSFYYLKTNKKGSLLSTIVLLFVVYAVFLWNNLGQGFIFQMVAPEDVDVLALSVGYFGLILLFTLCNYLVSSIQDGEGTFVAVFKMIVVSLVPFAISLVLVNILSYAATLNESFILQLIYYVGLGLSVIMLFLGIQYVHFYTFKKTIISILLTILLMAICIIVLLLIVILVTQLYQFIEVIIKEVTR